LNVVWGTCTRTGEGSMLLRQSVFRVNAETSTKHNYMETFLMNGSIFSMGKQSVFP